MLERKRILKVKDQLRLEGRRVFVYEHPRTGDMFTIVDPGLHLNQLEEVQRHVGHLLEHGTASPEALAVSPPATVASVSNDEGTGEGEEGSVEVPEVSPSPTAV
jgi:hypothetical protein